MTGQTPRGARGLIVAAIAAIALLACSAGATSTMAAEAPRWEIISAASPTNLVPNSPRNEVQHVTVDASGGTFKLSVSSVSCEEGNPFATEPISANATASEVRSALEALSCVVGAGGVTVTGGPGGASPYVVTFVGEHGNRPVSRMKADSSSLTGGAATASVTEAVRGAFPPYLTVTAINVGGATTDGSPITLEDALPASLTATSVSGYDAYASPFAGNGEGAAPMSCSAPPTLRCTYSGGVDPGDMLVMRINLEVGESAGENLNHATVAGGGGAAAGVDGANTVANTSAQFGPAPGSVIAATSTDRAGAHGNVTTAFTMSTSEPDAVPVDAKDIRFDLPPGLVGKTVDMPQCTMGNVLRLEREPNACASDTMVGIATLTINTQSGAGGGNFTVVTPIYNIAPAAGEPAAFGINALVLPVRLDTSVLSDGNYAVRVTAPNVNESAATLSAAVTVWGVPADHSGVGVNGETTVFGQQFGGPNPGETRTPLLTNPQQCGEGLSATMSVDPWTSPGAFVSSGAVPMGTLTGCDQLQLEPTFTMLPAKLEAGVPTGYLFDLQVPQSDEPDGLATPAVKDVRLTLPAGVVLSPSAASGLTACSSAQFFGPTHGEQEPARRAECPREAQVGTVEVKTPALPLPLHGEVFLGEPECRPCTPEDARDGRMTRLFVQVVTEGESPIIVKLEGRGRIDQQTGQLTATFENNPQLPFSELKLALNDGPRAALANPRTCGPRASTLDVTPWGAPLTADSTSSFGFEIDQGCFGPQFDPSFLAGATNNQAGGYSSFTVSLARSDHDQFLGGLELRMPPGLLGKLSSVTPCKEPRAAEGTCGAESLIGHLQILAGPGTSPLPIGGGELFLTESYKGAPFGLAIVAPAVAGPYTLAGTTGKGTVVVRATIRVAPNDAHLIVASDPFPTALDGIPLQVRAVEVTVDRNEFMFNPTNCGRLAVVGTLSSSEGTGIAVASPFQVANCATLPFKPKFTVSTQAKTSKASGASLEVKVISGPGQANIGKVKVDLPKQLPSRLTTLQKACTAAVFDANPAGCPAASVVGTGTALTPVLRGPLTGPVYIVSHGDVAFPDLVIVLQGEGITFHLVGNTDIKRGITHSRFETVPDAPISLFELKLPEGPHSALTTNIPATAKGSMCGQKLTMPTTLDGQNGATRTQMTRIAVTGCPNALSVSAYTVKSRTLTLHVVVPSTGRLTASGKGLAKASKFSAGRETLTLTVRQERASGRSTRVRLSFVPKQGKRLAKSLSVKFKR